MRDPSRTLQKIWAINQQAAEQWFALTGDTVGRFLSVHQTLLRDLRERPDPLHALESQGTYLKSLVGGAWTDARQRFEIVARASQQVGEALNSGWAGTAAGPAEADPAGVSAAAPTAAAAGQPPAADTSAADEASASAPPAVVDVYAADDNLEQISGVGSVTARMLREAGIGTVGDLARLDVSALEDESHPLHAIAGRIVADEIVEQARLLAGSPAARPH